MEVRGVALKAYFVQYKFIIPEGIKHSSYTYQKLFRAIYGYFQQVTKSNGKTYTYHRPGVLSDTPFIRHGKNCVVIHPTSFQPLLNFFKTGKNPGHIWEVKGDWKAVYYLNEKSLELDTAVPALEGLVDRTYISTPTKEQSLLIKEMEAIRQAASQNRKMDEFHKKIVFDSAHKIASHDWFKECYNKSPKLKNFYSLYSFLKQG